MIMNEAGPANGIVPTSLTAMRRGVETGPHDQDGGTRLCVSCDPGAFQAVKANEP